MQKLPTSKITQKLPIFTKTKFFLHLLMAVIQKQSNLFSIHCFHVRKETHWHVVIWSDFPRLLLLANSKRGKKYKVKMKEVLDSKNEMACNTSGVDLLLNGITSIAAAESGSGHSAFTNGQGKMQVICILITKMTLASRHYQAKQIL